ncbi:TPA: GA module-containing protein [Streptococcus suis]|nr:GA module-containing protein [Streptococcus suis]
MFKIKRNKLNRQEAFNFEKRSRFGIRKLTIGVVSLVIGSGMVLNGVEQVYAGTDYEPGVEIRQVRNGSPKEMAEGSAIPGTIAEKANYRDYKIETVPVVENGIHYVDVTLTFNERGRAYSSNRFYVFNMPNSLYEPKVITRETYQQAVEESQARVGNQTYTDYKVVASVKTSTLTTSGWREEPTNVAPGTERWGVNYRYINGNPQSSAYNSGNNTMRQIIGPGNNNSGEAISWIYTSASSYNGDWDRLISHDFSGKGTVVADFKNKSNSIYIEQARHSREKIVYKFRARVKDHNADMNFIFGMNEMIANGHANFVAKYGKTPDNRPYKERFPVNTPAKITVDNTSNLTRDNKLAIIAKIKEANSSLFGSDNSLKTPILVEPTEADIPTNATSGNITLRYTDGSTTTIPVANTVRQKVVATNNPAPKVVTALNYDAAKNSATKTENGLRTRIQLPEKLGVTDLGQIANSTAKIDPSNTNNTAENLWNAQLSAIRTRNIGTGGTFATNTYINNIGSASDPRENNGLYDMSAISRFALSLQKSPDGQIQGILVKGPNADNNGQENIGLITAEMLFKNVSSLEPVRQSARQEIDALGAIDGKDGWKNEINSATSEETIQAVVDKAKRAKADLDKAKDAAKAEIDAINGLTSEQKTRYKNEVESKTNKEQVRWPVDDAIKAALPALKEKAKAFVDNLEHLADNGDSNNPGKANFKEWIDDYSNTPEVVNNEVADAVIKNAKNKAIKELDALNPPPTNLAELKRQINEVTKENAKAQGKTGQEIIEAIVEKAKADSLKEQAKKDIAAVPGLSSTKKDEYKAKVDAATNVRDLEQIVSEAKAHAEYETAKQTIQGLPNLNTAQKTALLAFLDEDKTQAGIAATLDEARQQDSDMVRLKELEAQAEQLKNTSDYRDGAQDKKTALDNALAASKAITPENGSRPTVDLGQMIRNLEDGIQGLGQSPVVRTVDKSSLNAEIQRDSSVKAQNNYSYQFATESKKQAYETALQEAQAVANNQQATQDQVNAATDKLRNARLALDGHAPDRVQDTTPPVLGQPKQTPWSNILVHGASTIGKRAARPGVSTTEDVYGNQTTAVVELIVTDDESDVDLSSVQFTDTASSRLSALGLEYVPYNQQKDNGAIGYFATIGEGLVKDTGTEIVPIEFTVANTENVRSQTLTFQYLFKDDIAPTATVTEHVLIKDQDYNLNLDIRDNSLLGTEGPITVGDISIKPPGNSDSEPLTPTALGVTNGTSSAAFRLALKTPTPYYFDSPTSSRGNRSHEATLSFAGRPTAVLPRTTYRLRLYDSNHPTYNLPPEHRGNESFTDITFTVVDRLAAPAENAKVTVNNPSRLTEDEKNAIKQAVKTANPHIAAIDNAANGDTNKQVRIDVAENGRVTVTYPHGGKTDTLEANLVTKENRAPIAHVEEFGPKRQVTGNQIPDSNPNDRNRPTVFVFANQAIPTGREGLTREVLETKNMGFLKMTDPDGDTLREVNITNINSASIGIKVSPNGTLSGTPTSVLNPGQGWVAMVKPVDQHGKQGNPVYFHFRAYTDKLVADAETNPVAGTYGQAVRDQDIFSKLTIDARSRDTAVPETFTVPDGSNPAEKAQYTRTITGYSSTNNGQGVTTVKNGVAGLPTQGTYYAEVTTTNIWGQTIKNYVKVVYALLTDTLNPQAPTTPVNIQGDTVQESEKPRIIQALKDANPSITFPETTRFEVAEDGTVTIIYPDDSTATPSRDTVRVPTESNPAPTFGDFGVNTTSGNSTYKTIFVFGAKTNGSAVEEYAPDFVPADATGRIPVQDNTGIAKVELIGIDNENKVTNTGIAFTPDGKLLGEFNRDQSTNLVRNGINGVWYHRIKATDNGNPAKSAITSTIRIKAYRVEKTDETAIAKVYGTALTQDELTNKLRVAVSSGMTVPADNHSHKVAGYTVNNQFTAITNISELPTSGNYTVKMETTNVYGQTIVNNIAVDYNEQKDVIEPIAPTQQALIDGAAPTTDADKTALINALKEANKTPEGTSKFPENTRFDVAENGAVTITYPDNSSETVTVPFKQKDSAQHTPVVAETPINSAATAGTELTEDERNAVKAAVTVPNFPAGDRQPTVTVPADARVTDGTNGNTGKPVVVATVEYPDGSRENVEVPVRQRDTAKYEASVTNPEAPAAIKASHETGTQITDQADKDAILAKVSVPEGSSGRPSLDQNPVVEERDGKQVVKVTVTYPDQTTDTVYVPVDQKDNETHNPTAPAEAVKLDAPATANSTLSDDDKNAIKAAVTVPANSGGQVSLPEDAKVELVNGNPVVKATVTYPDGTTDIVEVPVVQKDSTKYDATAKETPVPLDSPVTPGQTLSAEEREALKFGVNVPAGSNGEIHVPENAAVKLVGDKPVVEAEVRYPDGTVDKVQVPVRQYDRAVYTPNLVNPKEVPISVEPTNDTQITSPDDAAILANVDVPAATPDGTKPEVTKTIASPVKDGTGANQGKKVVEVEITYPDKSKEKIEVPVKHADNQVHNPEAPTKPVQLDVAATTDTSLSDADKQAVKDAVTIPQGSGGVASLPEDAKVVDRNGTPVVPVTVTYPDGTTETVDVPVVQKDSTKHTPVLTEANSPVLTDTPAKANEPVQETDKAAIAAKVDKTTLPPGTETKVPDDSVVELENGKPVVPVLVSYPDGTSEIIKVPVDQKDDLTYNPEAPNKDNAVAITSPQTQGTEITDPTDKAAILDSVTVPAVDGGQVPQVTKEIASPVTEGPDGPYVTVKVSYPDGTSETVNVPVNQKDNETHNPTVPEKAVQVDAPAVQDGTLSEDDKKAIKDTVVIPEGSGGQASLPADAKVIDRNGTPVVPVTVTYPDNTTDTVYVPVVQKDSVKHTPSLTDADQPVLTDTPAKAETPVQDTDKAAIAAKVDKKTLPQGTETKVPDGAKVELDGDKPVVPVLVSYPDGTSEIIKVPVDQKDSETYKPTAPAAEAPVAITGSDAPDAPIAEADKPAILNSVTVSAVDGGQAPKVTKEITSPVKVVDGKAFVEVTVTYPDKTSEVIPVPVNQKDNEANTPTVTAPEKPAPISVPVAENTPVETDADKKLITDKVNVAGLPNPPQSVKVAEPAKVVLDQAGNPVVNVEVTYPDGTKDIVPVPVKQADNQTNTPSLKDPEVGKPAEVLVAIDPTPGVAINNPMDKEAIAAKVDLSKLPAGTTAEVADGAVVANDPLTNKPVVPVTVTYPDGTSETINVPVKQADNLAMDPSLKDTNPVPILTEATVGLTVSDKANLDAIVAKVDPKTGKAEVVNNTIVAGKEDGPHAGQPVVNVLVTYPDGTQDTIEVPVKQADNVVKEPSLTDQTPVPIQAAATTGTTVPADDKQAILAKVKVPEGANATIADDATVVREDGQPVVPVTVTYPDGTTDTISVPVKRADNSKYTPSQVTDPVQVDAATAPGTAITSQDDKDAIIAAVPVPKVAAGEKAPVVSLPENPQVEVVNDQPVVKAIVTYADGTTDTVDVPIVQKVSATKEPSLKETEPGKPAQAVITENPTAGKAITDPADQKAIFDKVVVPEGGKASIADDAVVEMDGDQPVLPVTVTYTDGSKDIIKVPVKQADNVAKEPSLKNQTPVGVMDAPAVGAQVEEPTDLEAIKNNVDTKGGTASIEDPTIVEGPNNQPAVAVTVTYPDGTTDTILVPIKTADNVTYTPVLKSTDPVLVSVATDNGTAVPEADQAKILANVDVPALTADGDKPAVDLSIENPVVLQKNGQAGVEVTVTYQDGSKDKIFVPVDTDTDKDGFSNKEEEKAGTSATDPASTPDGQDSAERLNPGLTEPVEVKNPDKLTDAEKEAVKKAVEASNDLPAGTTVSVANDGTVTVTYPDNSTDTIKPKDAVTQFVDTDGDGISDRQETENGTDPSKVDSDNDGFSDKEEVERGTDPTKADSKPASSETDTDGDGISNEDEVARGTDPNKSDTDGDGFSDQEEITAGSNPTKADSTPANVDKDGDGFTDTEEAAAGTDANNPASTPAGQDSADRLNPGLTEPVEVKNPDKLTDAEKEAVKKAVEDSNDLPAGTEITVSDNGTVTVTYPDNSTDTIKPAETVKVAKDTDKDGFTDTEEATAGTDATNPASTPAGQDSAGQLTPSLAEPVEVKNPDKLTDAEKESVKKAVEDSNDLPEGTEVSVSDNGTVTVTYPDKSTDTIQPAETVKVAKDTDKDGFTDTEEEKAGTNATDPSSTPAGQDSAGQLTPGLTEPVEVKNPDKLTDAEKDAVKKAVEDSNDLPEGTEVTVSDNGTVTVTYPDKSTDTIQPAETVKVAKDTDKDGFTDTEEEKAGTNATDPSSTPAGQDSAGQLTPSLTEPVEVKNPDKLTDAEKEAVKKAVEDSNDLPEGTEVTVSDNGTVTVTYPDKSADTIQPTDTVKAAKPVSETPVAPSKPEVTATDSGAVVVTPPTDNVTNLDITFTPEGASQPVTVVVSKDENGIWTAPADSGLVINSDGTITIPAEKVADGTAVTVVAENGSISSPEVGSTVVPVPAVTPETPVAPSKPEVTATDSGAVVVTPPTDNVTNLDITFTPEGSSQPVTVVVSKDATGTWTAPADSGLVVNPDGTITIPAENVADGTAVTVVAENGSVSSPEVGSAVVPVPTPELPAIPAKPTSVTNADGSVTIVPPVENVTGLDITFTPEGATEPVTVTLGKDATGAWTAPADSGLVVNPDGTITIPADRLADGTEGQVGLVAKNGDLTSNDPAPQVPETPAKSSVETNENGSVTIVPPVENVTGIDITFTPEGASQPVTVVVSKDATGAWTAPADSGLVVNPDGTITIPADKVADGTAVSVVTKNGQVPSDEASATYVPAKPASTDTPVVEVPATPSLALDGSGNVLITPPAENATSLDITFTPAGSETPITVTANKDATGNWILPETSIAVVNPDGTISISTSEMEGGTAVSVVAKNEGVPSSQAATLLVQPKQTAEELAPTVKKPIAVEDASKLTDAEKKELEDVVRKDNVLPEGTEVSVADDGTVTVTYPDKSTDTILPTKTVMDAQNGKGTSHSLPAYDLTADEDKDGFTNEEELKQGSNVADAKSVPAGKSSAERLTPTNDLAVKVKDLTKLSDAEKETVETAIRKDKDLPEGTQIEVANDGSVTITYPDGSIGRLPADQTVLQVAHGEGTSHSLPAYDLTADEDKDGFTNEEELKQGSNVADAKSVPAGKSSAERLTPTNDLAVKVKDLTKLTDAEKKAVETAIRKNNTLPEGTQIEVANDGSVTITYPDGSVDQIVATKVVATDSTVSPDSGVSQSSGTTKVLPGSASSTRAAKKPLPATGENGSPILVLSGLALLAGVAMFRKAKREDEN